MTSTGSRMICDQNIARTKILYPTNLLFYRLAHGPEVNRNMGGIGHQVAVRAKQGAGKIEPLLDIG